MPIPSPPLPVRAGAVAPPRTDPFVVVAYLGVVAILVTAACALLDSITAPLWLRASAGLILGAVFALDAASSRWAHQ